MNEKVHFLEIVTFYKVVCKKFLIEKRDILVKVEGTSGFA